MRNLKENNFYFISVEGVWKEMRERKTHLQVIGTGKDMLTAMTILIVCLLFI